MKRYAILLDETGQAIGQLERCGDTWRGHIGFRAVESPLDRISVPDTGGPYSYALVDEPLTALGLVIGVPANPRRVPRESPTTTNRND